MISVPYAIIFFLTLLSEYFQNYPKLTEEEVFKIIKDFFTIVKQWDEKDYLLTNNLILQESYWSCEIDILLITKKWIYVIEVKHQLSKWLSGGINDEYLKASPWRPHPGNQIYSPFYQNQQHINRLKRWLEDKTWTEIKKGKRAIWPSSLFYRIQQIN